MLILNINDLDRMKLEFHEAFEDIFYNAFARLNKSLKVKLCAIDYCNEFL